MGDSPGETSPAGDEVYRLAEQAKRLQETAPSIISRISREADTLRQRVAALDSCINSLRSKRDDDLIRARYILSEGDAAVFLPNKSQGRFLRIFRGTINGRASRNLGFRLKVKDEYNSFRDRTAYLFLCLPSLLLMLRFSIWEGCLPALPVQLYQAWFLYLYTGLALKENILRVNGSNIHPCGEEVGAWWKQEAGSYDFPKEIKKPLY